MNKPEIIIADDDPMVLRLLQQRLENACYGVSTCGSGEEALDLVQRKKSAMLLLDWNMPGMTGLETCRKIRKSKAGGDVYIILLTGNDQPEQVAEGLDAGADDYLVKAAHPAILLARVRCGERALLAQLQARKYAASLEAEVDERKRAEHDLREAQREAQQLLEAISSVLLSVDVAGHVTAWNHTAQRVLGIDAADAIGRSLQELPLAWDRSALAKGFAECRDKNRPARLDEVRFERNDGLHGFLGITLNPLCGAAGEYAGLLLVAADISEYKALQSQLSHAQKLESIGQLAAGVAHEINTPTQYVGDNLRFLLDNLPDLLAMIDKYSAVLDPAGGASAWAQRQAEIASSLEALDIDFLREEIPKSIAQALDGVERVATIVRSMKEFSHPGGEDKQATDLNKAIETTITVARNEWKYVAEMVTDLDPELPAVPCLAGEFNQVILNMIVNAAHAIADVVGTDAEDKGTITIKTRADGEFAEIRIADTGTGMPPEVKARIFDPFFTTKEVGKGTGQGLSIAHVTIVKKHGGTIAVESQVGKGTTFVIRLPIDALTESDAENGEVETAEAIC